MSIDKIAPVGTGSSPISDSHQKSFGKMFEEVKGVGKSDPRAGVESSGVRSPASQEIDAIRGVNKAEGIDKANASKTEVVLNGRVEKPDSVLQAAEVVEHMESAQRKLSQILHLAESGRSFTSAELLALQAQVYQVSQELDLAGKIVEKATGGVKQVLQTQV